MSAPSTEPEFAADGYEVKLDITFPASLSYVDGVVERVTELLAAIRCSEEKQYSIVLAIHEALVNAVRHGAKSDPGKTVRCSVAVNKENGTIIIIRDPGEGFDPERLADCHAAENIYEDHGRGIHLIMRLMDKVEFHHHGAEIRLHKS